MRGKKALKTFLVPGKENKLNVCTVFATLAGSAKGWAIWL